MSFGARLMLGAGTLIRILLVPVIVFLATALDRNYQTDFWHHLARGEAMVARGGLVDEDLFTFTVSGRAFQDNNWLTQLYFVALYRLGGLPLVQTVNSLLVATVLGLLVWRCKKHAGGSILLANLLGIVAFLGLWQLLIIRPQTFSLLLFVLLYGVLDDAWSDGRRWRLLGAWPILALWSNLHGGFPIGLVLIGTFTMAAGVRAWWEKGWRAYTDRTAWAYAGCLAGAVAATFINPYGWTVYRYVRTTSAVASGRNILEWLPPSFGMLVGMVWIATVVLMVVLFALPRRRPTILEVCLVVVFLPLACNAVRMVPWWLLAVMPVAAALLKDNLPAAYLAETPEKPSWANPAVLAALAAAVVICAPPLEDYNPLVGTLRPKHRLEYDLNEIAQYLERHPPTGSEPGRLFSRFEWGEYLGWRLYPRYQVFVDARIEIYPKDVWEQFEAVSAVRADWQQILDGYRVDYLVLDNGPRSHHPGLLTQAGQSPQWEKVHEAGPAVLFRRRPRSD